MSQPTSNEEFLAAVFGTDRSAPTPWVCLFDGDPKHGNWHGYQFRPGLGAAPPADVNTYFTLATYRPGAPCRQAGQCAGIAGLMLDDVGTKGLGLQALCARLPPSLVVETSPGNYQVTYLFPGLETDLELVTSLWQAASVAGLGDPGANSAATRYGRLPFGINGKHSPAFKVSPLSIELQRRYTPAQIADALGLDLAGTRRERKERAFGHNATAFLALSEAEQCTKIAELRSALGYVSADERPTWIKVGLFLKADLPEEIGRELWEEWSRTSPKCDEDGLESWGTFAPDHCGHAAVFQMASERGWVNPRSPAQRDFSKVGFGEGVTLPPGASPVPLALVTQLPSPAPFKRVSVADVTDRPPDPQAWWWDGRIPAGETTLLSGHGGVGKSAFALALGVCIAAGLPMLGESVMPGHVLFFSAEDPGPTLRRRLARIIRHFGLDAARVAERLTVLDATDGDPMLFGPDGRTRGGGALTATMAALRDAVEESGAPVLIVDNASDTFGGDEIARSQVRAFIRALSQLVRPRGGAAILLAHVDKNTSRAGGRPTDSEGYSGSTAWHNSVRSRLFLTQTDGDMLELRHQKSNLGARMAPLLIGWSDGLPLALIQAPVANDEEATAALLQCVRAAMEMGKRLAPSRNSAYSATKVLSALPNYPKGLDERTAHRLLQEAEAAGRLVQVEKVADGKRYFGWVVPQIALAA